MNLHVPPSPLRLGLDLSRSALPFVVPIWLFVLFVAAVIASIVNAVGTVSDSIVDFAAMPPRYWVLATGVILAAVCFGPYIASGVTRRAFSGGLVVAGAVISTVLALIMTAGYYVEGIVYGAFGWEQALGNKHLFDTTGQVGAVFVETFLVYAAHFAAGWVVSASFLRCRWFVAVLGATAGYLSAAVAEWGLGTGWSGAVSRSVLERAVSLSIGVPLAVTMIVVAAVVAWRITAAAPVSRRMA